MNYIVKIKNLVKKYNGVTAVDNISMEIAEGGIMGLLGPNGAGKSTTINIITGLIAMDKGSIYVCGMDIKKHGNDVKKNIGVVPQEIAIYEDLTALENVMFFASLYGLSGRLLKQRAKEALEFTGLIDKAKNFPKEFSGGMKRRLNIACAIAHRPKLVIMDEPTVSIDPQSRNHILQSVRTLNQMGSTIIYTSHYMEEVEEICTDIAIMDHGKIIARGSKEELTGMISDTDTLWIVPECSICGIDIGKIKQINGVAAVEAEDGAIRISNIRNANNLDRIISYFMSNRIIIKNLEIKRPDLETVFLTLTGRKLRD